MSILIHGMKMPKTCCGCKMMIYNPELVWDDNGKETVGAWVCLLTAELIDNTKREENCPLIELPPHGRLGDLDALIIDLMDRGVDGVQTDDLHEILQTIMDAETIIPADPEGGADG